MDQTLLLVVVQRPFKSSRDSKKENENKYSILKNYAMN
jgi:hypothetical protein